MVIYSMSIEMKPDSSPHKRRERASRLPMMIGVVCAALLFSSCGHKMIPEEVERKVDWTLSFEAIKADANPYLGKTILVGGEIIETRNKKEVTEMEILQKPLGRDHRPLFVDESKGRFIYIHPAFLDPSIYKSGRMVTVVGRVEVSRSQAVGDAQIVYPVLAGEHLYLWPPYRPYPGHVDPTIGIGFGFGTVYHR